MKNEWDMFAAVRKRLDAGEQIVKIYLTTPTGDRRPGELGEALDEEGEAYELGPEFAEAMQACIRAHRISWSLRNDSKTLSFGPGLNEPPSPPNLPGVKHIDLMDEKVDFLDLFGSDDEDDTDDNWWRA